MRRRILVDALFPTDARCALCGCERDVSPGASLCEKCASSLKIDAYPVPCTGGQALAALVHEGGAAVLVHALKYKASGAAAYALSSFMAECARAVAPADAVLVPVPLHPSRYLRRGYNQAAWLARALSDRTGMPVLRALKRVRATPHQTGRTRAFRLSNVRGAFAARDAEKIRGRHVLLVDDVLTTGATLEACAEVLTACGARGVSAVTATHAYGDPSKGHAPSF